jgi:3-dehydroquinate synthase
MSALMSLGYDQMQLAPFSAALAQQALSIDFGTRSYPIEIGLLDWRELGLRLTHRGGLAVVVTNATVGAHHGLRLRVALQTAFTEVRELVLPDGETFKSWTSLQSIQDALAQAGADRKVTLFALGGGVIGDLTGFAAATWMRGVRFVQVPTTLLAQVDSSVGGKTGINLEAGKNLVGAFHQPAAVWADLGTLKTLPTREFSAGLAEVIKYGPVADMAFFAWLEDNMGLLLQRDERALAVAVRRSCEIKAAVVAADEYEGGLRAILNFGHTFGHALEAGLGYGELLHGEAVGIGMLMACSLSSTCLGLEAGLLARLHKLLVMAGLPVRAPRMPEDRFLALMRGDKKSQAGKVRYVLLSRPGVAQLVEASDESALAAVRTHTV